MALWLSYTTCEVAVFSGGYWSQVSDLTKFPPSNMQALCFHTPQHHGTFFSTGEADLNKLKALDRWWEALANVGIFPSWLTKNTQDDQSGWDCGKIKDFFWLPCKFNFCKSPAVKVKSHHHPVDLAQCFL